jgi:hypothetical protein
VYDKLKSEQARSINQTHESISRLTADFRRPLSSPDTPENFNPRAWERTARESIGNKGQNRYSRRGRVYDRPQSQRLMEPIAKSSRPSRRRNRSCAQFTIAYPNRIEKAGGKRKGQIVGVYRLPFAYGRGKLAGTLPDFPARIFPTTLIEYFHHCGTNWFRSRSSLFSASNDTPHSNARTMVSSIIRFVSDFMCFNSFLIKEAIDMRLTRRFALLFSHLEEKNI